jgi:DNA polymerase-3 subunit gamma/tau
MASKKDKVSDKGGSDNAAPAADPQEPSLGLSGGSSKSGGAYRVLARKYRPQTFEDAFIGQAAVVRTLSNAFAAGRIAHAFMLTGVRGVGKTTTARIIAKALNCIGRDGKLAAPTVTPCGVCDPCVSIAESRNVDVQEMDAASHTGIDDIREIIEGVRYAPAQARYKVYIIDEVHMLSKSAFNGLLKTLEEPPPHVKFAFATTEIRKVPITVLSRCQRFDLKRVSVDELTTHLVRICEAEKQPASEQALRLIARAAEGSVRDSLSLLDQAFAHAGGAEIEEEPVRVMLGLADRSRGLDLFERLMRGAVAEALAEFRNQYDAGADPLAVMQDMTQICHEVTRNKVTGGHSISGAPAEEARRITDLGAKLSIPQLARTWQLLLKALSEVQSAPDAAAAAEMAMVRISFASELPPTEQLVRNLGTGQGAASAPRAPSGAGASSAPPPPAPSLRVNGGRNETVMNQAPAPVGRATAEHAVAQATSEEGWLNSFKDIVEFVRAKREMRLLFALENWVHLVAFERERLEIRVAPAAPPTLPGEISDRLSKWTGVRWIVSVSGAEGEPTITEQRIAHEKVRLEAAQQDPLLKAAMAAFPGARILAVRDRDEFAAPTEGGDNE